jgi:hypothetical protein
MAVSRMLLDSWEMVTSNIDDKEMVQLIQVVALMSFVVLAELIDLSENTEPLEVLEKCLIVCGSGPIQKNQAGVTCPACLNFILAFIITFEILVKTRRLSG